MHIEFFGAAREVTGSCHILHLGGDTILLDCGMIQGGIEREARNADPFPFDPRCIDAVVLSHAHIDHCGRLPLLVKHGFKGSVHTHQASRALTSILLRDSANLAASRARHAESSPDETSKEGPLYDLRDVERTLPMLIGHPYRHWFDVLPGVKVRFLDAGHILVSGVVEVHLHQSDTHRRIVFSGDLGQYDSPILRDPESPREADLVVMESTYGDRRHKDRARSLLELGDLIRDSDTNRSTIVVPAFAVGRSQELLYQLGKHAGEWALHRWEIFLDSPLAIEATAIYWRHQHLFDEEADALRREFESMPELPNLHFARTADESKRISRLGKGAIIIAGSGTCGGGRILHHLKIMLSDRENHVLFTGYQPPGGLGRRLIDGADKVWIHGQSVEVNAQIHTIGGLSAHGDYEDLLRWYRGIQGKPPVYLVHGDPAAMQALQFRLTTAAAKVHIPEPGERISF